MEEFSRTELLLGKDAMKKLNNAKIAVFGVGGVGSYTVEALARSGIGHFTLFDADTVSVSNINRQIIATQQTIGRRKVEVAKERILLINPTAEIEIHSVFYLPENAMHYDLSKYTYIVDAIDTITAKIELISRASTLSIPIISSMGAGNKLNPCGFMVEDIYKTSACPLARVMRRELKKRGVESLKTVYSKEIPIEPRTNLTEDKRTPGSVAFVPSVVGLIIAGEVIKDIIA